MSTFKPSRKSLTPNQEAMASLRYAKKAIEALEAKLSKPDPTPAWVVQKINQAAFALGAALTYLSKSTKAAS